MAKNQGNSAPKSRGPYDFSQFSESKEMRKLEPSRDATNVNFITRFDPTCQFTRVESNGGLEDDVIPEEDEVVPVAVAAPLPIRKVRVLCPVREDPLRPQDVDKVRYIEMFKKCKSCVKNGTIGPKSQNPFLRSPKVLKRWINRN